MDVHDVMEPVHELGAGLTAEAARIVVDSAMDNLPATVSDYLAPLGIRRVLGDVERIEELPVHRVVRKLSDVAH